MRGDILKIFVGSTDPSELPQAVLVAGTVLPEGQAAARRSAAGGPALRGHFQAEEDRHQ